ncbi:hypothetical protein MMC26_000161 [Xylographa opegraphella]|nr:hypothetical protein [Xylographa opegraphella]
MSGQYSRVSNGASNGLPLDSVRNPEAEGHSGGAVVSNMTRAQRFEDEKKRIIESCFARRDEDGAYSESYITHIRITEDAASPSSPPPPNSLPENKKLRVIVVAVKKSGRVRMHKARENPNGTFSIGKTWNLDDLATIESFSGPPSATFEEQKRQQWAGDSGMLITIQKPYYWQAATSKEKDFFIGSLIKIYRKYTGGKLPQLIGFNSMEFSELTIPPGKRPTTPQRPSSRPGPSPVPGNPQSSEYPPTPTRAPNREPSRELKSQASSDLSSRKEGSEDRGLAIPDHFPPSDFIRSLRPPEPRTRLQPFRSDSPSASSQRDTSSNPPSPQTERSLRSLAGATSVESFQSRQGSKDGPLPTSNPHIEHLRTNVTYSPVNRVDTVPQPAPPKSPDRGLPAASRVASNPGTQPRREQVPERRRPPISIPVGKTGTAPESPQEFVTPSEDTASYALGEPSQRNASVTVNGGQNRSSEGYFVDAAERFTGSKELKDSIVFDSKDVAASSPGVSTLPSALNQLSQLSSPATPTSPELPSEEIHRPGLGPMIKKKSTKEIANVFRKAALTHNAFKPRLGGAAERVKDESPKTPNTPDGINGVFPAPSLLRDTSQDKLNIPATLPAPLSRPLTPNLSEVVPNVTVTPSPVSAVADTKTLAEHTVKMPSPSPERNPSSTSSQADGRRKRRSNHSAKYAKALGIDHNLLEDRTTDIESILTDFGWGDGEVVRTTYDNLQNAIKRDMAKIETGSWLGSLEHTDERVTVVSNMLDKAIAECEELDGLLTLYNVELGTLSEDIAYIEAQSQGLQVQTANQRLLYGELKTLLETITISSSQLKVLKEASLTSPQGVQDVENALISLYKAMVTIDPGLRQTNSRPSSANGHSLADPSSAIDKVGNEVSTMRAVQEKKDRYRIESVEFVQRFKQQMSAKFLEAEAETSTAIEKNRHGTLLNSSSKLDLRRRDASRAGLWIYSPLMLFAREMEVFEWEEILRIYEGTAKRPYQEEFKENITAWKRIARKPTGEEQEYLFTIQEKESDNIVARKLTVKRTKTIREGSRNSSNEKLQDGRINGFEAFAGALFDMSQAIFVEQNFVVDLFHVSSLENVEFPDVVATSSPEKRLGSNLGERKLFDPDRSMAKRVQNMMDDVFSFWPSEMQNLVDWVVKQDTLQIVGLIFAIESKLSELEETNQEFLIQTLSKLHSRLTIRFERFIDEQIRGIEDTKVKIKKRKGVIAFVKTFPYFSASLEIMLPTPRADTYDVRHLVNDVYTKINKTMFESLKFIAKESPVVMTAQKPQGQLVGDAEDKEILNYHILLIENMNHYFEEVDVRGNSVLGSWRDRAIHEMAEHMDLYLSAVIRRPLGKLLDFLESTESLLANATDGPTSIATRASHSRSTFKKLLSTFDAKEIRRGIDTLKKRVEKHFGDADDPNLSRNLVQTVLRECEERYVSVHDRTGRIVAEVYEGGLEIEFKKEDVASAFRR